MHDISFHWVRLRFKKENLTVNVSEFEAVVVVLQIKLPLPASSGRCFLHKKDILWRDILKIFRDTQYIYSLKFKFI